MMADASVGQTHRVPIAAREILLPEPAEAWRRLGFAVGEDGAFATGGVRLVTGAAELGVRVEGLAAEAPDGLALTAGAAPAAAPAAAQAHANGAVALDHVVALTDDLDRTLAALQAAGLDLRRVHEEARQGFLRLGPLILEVAERPVERPALWGLVAVVEDLDACARRLGPLLGSAREAVQPGRRIATVRRDAGIVTALAFMTPRPQRTPPG
jgi:hypothetical protein